MPYFNFLDALKEKGCAICFLLAKAIRKSMDDFLYERVNDPVVRKEIRGSLGFCPLHAWQLQKIGDSFGQSVIYEDLMKRALSHIEGTVAPGKKIKGFLKTKTACPVCKLRGEAERRYIAVFNGGLDEPEFQSSYRNSFGLCLPHLTEAIKRCKEKKTAGLLLSIEAKKIKGLIRELKEVQRKHDYRFSHEGFGKEGNAWVRAIEKMAGKEGVF